MSNSFSCISEFIACRRNSAAECMLMLWSSSSLRTQANTSSFRWLIAASSRCHCTSILPGSFIATSSWNCVKDNPSVTFVWSIQ